jgi:3-oxoacyl-[acyl-carrier-protein] synthase-3
MSFFKFEGIEIKGIKAILPNNIEKNNTIYDNEIAEDFQNKTGIFDRYTVPENSNPIFDYMYQASIDILSKIDWHSDTIDLMICVTQTPDKSFPSLSNRLHGALSISQNCLCFDVNIGCSGYTYGLNMVYSILSNIAKIDARALLIVGDISTKFIPFDNKGIRALFSDAISVTAIEKTNSNNPSYFFLETYGSGHNAIKSIFKEGKEEMAIDGLEVYQYSVKHVPDNIMSLLKFAEINLHQIDYFVFHQANKLINNFLYRKLGISYEKYLSSLEYVGNTSSSSIPITILTNKEKFYDNNLLMLSGFGVGFSVASAIINLDGHNYFNLSYYEN